jgi:transaldolase
MTTPLESLVATGTKLWLDSVDPDLVKENRKFGATGATSNPIIISDLIKTGRFDDKMTELLERGLSDEEIAWEMTDFVVRQAQGVFADVNTATKGNDGYVSFELDPLLEDASCKLSVSDKAARYVELGKKWAAGHTNRMIKVPGTPGGLAALEQLAAAGITLNVTLLFSNRQYVLARDAVWRGAQKRKSLDRFKSVYSIFISRIDVYTKQHVPDLSPAAQGLVGIVNAKRLWRENNEFWKDKKLPLAEEFIFASTGTKDKADPPDKYVSALAGSDIQTNPPATNEAIQKMPNKTFTRMVDQLPPKAVLDEIDRKIDFQKLETVLMDEGTRKFADPHKKLLALIAQKRSSLAPSGR